MRRRLATARCSATPGIHATRGRADRAVAGRTRLALALLAAFVFGALLALPASARAQQVAAARFTLPPHALSSDPAALGPAASLRDCCQRDSLPQAPVSAMHMADWGFGFGVAGLLAGGLIGSTFDDHSNCTGEICDATGAFVGAGVGEVVAVPLGIHLANHRRGSLLYDYAASTVAMLAAGLVFGSAASASEEVAAIGSIAIPVAQIAASVWAERRRTR